MSLRRWIQDHPRPLEWAYRITERLFHTLDPLFSRLGYDRVARLILPLEKLSRELVFDCRMCGQCILRLTGMTCPMTCPGNQEMVCTTKLPGLRIILLAPAWNLVSS